MRGQENVTVLFFIKRTKLLKNGEAPIYIRITINKERTEFGLKKSVLPKEWLDKSQRVKESAKSSKAINSLLEEHKNKINTITNFLKMEGEEITPNIIKEKLNGKKEDRRTILKIFSDHNSDAKKLIGKDFAPDTVQRYETSYMHTKDFIKWHYKREDLALEELNQQFVKQFEVYLKSERNCSHNTAIKYLKNFKKIVRIALANNWLKNDPFAAIKFKLKPVDAVFLISEELKTISEKEIHIQRVEQIKDIFLFCCYTGLAFADVKSLKPEHITFDSDGIMWIHKKRQKTNQMSTIFVIDAAKRILEKYENNPQAQKKGVLLPVITNQKMNLYLKEIADVCEIDKPISTHTARHTFATTVALGNNIPIEVVSKSLGHSSIKMTERYARTTENLIKKNMMNIINQY